MSWARKHELRMTVPPQRSLRVLSCEQWSDCGCRCLWLDLCLGAHMYTCAPERSGGGESVNLWCEQLFDFWELARAGGGAEPREENFTVSGPNNISILSFIFYFNIC